MKHIILIFLLHITLITCASTKKKSTDNAETTDNQTAAPAILAIEIVDHNDTSTEVRNNTKRTIESALGYGFQGNYYPTSQEKKIMIYPYSQEDIPPYTSKQDTSKYQSIQKSQYNIGQKLQSSAPKQVYAQETVPSQNQNYYPSTLYSSVGQAGLVGGLSSQLPIQQTSATTVPVIILRVYSNQLSDQAIYPNLPQTHPYANNLNSINLQSIIANYLQQQMYQIQQMYKNVPYPNSGAVYAGVQAQNMAYHQPQEIYQQNSADNLPTHENYPSEKHTRVIYHGPRGHINIPNYTSGSYSTASSYGTPSISQMYAGPVQSYVQSQSYSSPSQNYGTPAGNSQSYAAAGQSYSGASQSYSGAGQSYAGAGQGYSGASQNYETPSVSSQSYSPPAQTYETPDTSQTYTASNTQQVYTDANGQSYIYVNSNELQGGQNQGGQQEYYQQQEAYPQQDYTQQEYVQQDFKTSQEDRRYLPTQTPDKLYNYHSGSVKDRSKKSSGAPQTFHTKDNSKTDKKS